MEPLLGDDVAVPGRYETTLKSIYTSDFRAHLCIELVHFR